MLKLLRCCPRLRPGLSSTRRGVENLSVSSFALACSTSTSKPPLSLMRGATLAERLLRSLLPGRLEPDEATDVPGVTLSRRSFGNFGAAPALCGPTLALDEEDATDLRTASHLDDGKSSDLPFLFCRAI